MRVLRLLFISSVLLFGACKHNPRQQQSGYILSIDQNKIEKAVDTIYNGKRYDFLRVPVELTNFSNDTLKYVNMTCSWDEIFTFNKKTISIEGWSCDSNFPTVYCIAPQKSYTYKMPILIEKAAVTNDYAFRIGLYLFKYSENSGFRDFESFLDSKNITSPHSNKTVYKNIIWSNEVSVSK